MTTKGIRLFMAFAAMTAALQIKAQAPHNERIYLSGTGIDHTRTWEFYCSEGNHSGKWGKIEVPCNWEIQGYGGYTYGRWYVEPDGKPTTEVGTYRHHFMAPQSWDGKQVDIVFDGVMTDTEVLVNGKLAGTMHQGGFNRFKYNITPLLTLGKKNELVVKVAKHSANKSINAAERKADWWLYGGIYRPVWLEVNPIIHMEHYTLNATAEGDLDVLLRMSDPADGYSVALSLTALKDGKVMTGTEGTRVVQAIRTNKNEFKFSTHWNDVKRWDTEHPNLYVAKLELVDKDGTIVQTRETRVGFRTIEFVPQEGFFMNGVKLVMKGINRHSFWPDGGRATSAELSRKDALLIKEMNMNAVRSHYAPDEHFLDMCDSLGIVYMDELAGWQNAYDTQVGSILVKEMVERDVNHPCIVIWSNGNEGGWNTDLDPLFAKYDPLQKRHVVHPWADFNGVDTHHYPAYLTGVARFNNGHKVFMPTEFMHALYDQGGGAGLKDFWERWTESPFFNGAFIWAFCDEAVKRSDKNGMLDSDKSNAPDGVVGPRREKEGSYYAIREVWCPIQVEPLRIGAHFDGRIMVSNHFLYTNLDACRMTYRVTTNGNPLSADTATNKVVVQGFVKLPSLAPGERGTASFVVPDNFHEGDVLTFEAYDADNHSVGTFSYPILLPNEYFKQMLSSVPATLAANQCSAERGMGKVVLNSPRVKVVFDDRNGQITEVTADGCAIPFNNGPVAVGMKMRYDAEASDARQTVDGAIFCARYKGAADSIVWKLTNDGLLYMNAILLNRAQGGGGFDDAFMDTEVYNLGLTFSYPESNCTGMKWMGKGPFRVWKNRLPGTNYGVWQKAYNNTITGESFENLVYPEFKGYHADLYWATVESNQCPFSVYAASDGVYLRMFTPEEPAGRARGRATMPRFPEGDISFLLDIPSICSFKPIKQQGPQSQPGNIRIKEGDEGLHLDLMFDFRQPMEQSAVKPNKKRKR